MKKETAYFRQRLSTRIGKLAVNELANYVCEDSQTRARVLLALVLTENDHLIQWQAAWLLDTVCRKRPLLDEADCRILATAVCQGHASNSVRRLMMNLLLSHQAQMAVHVPLYNWCIEHAFLPQEKPGTQAVCLKLVAAMCDKEPELLPELLFILEQIEPQYYTPALLSTVRQVRKHFMARIR